MKKKQITIYVLIFIAGIIIGSLIILSFNGKSVTNTVQILLLEQRVGWERRAYQAYSDENTQVAIWALENLVDVLKKHAAIIKNDRELIQKDLVLTYGRLAILHKDAKDSDNYDEYMSKALTLSKQAFPGSLHTKEKLIDFVKNLDKAANKERTNNS